MIDKFKFSKKEMLSYIKTNSKGMHWWLLVIYTIEKSLLSLICEEHLQINKKSASNPNSKNEHRIWIQSDSEKKTTNTYLQVSNLIAIKERKFKIRRLKSKGQKWKQSPQQIWNQHRLRSLGALWHINMPSSCWKTTCPPECRVAVTGDATCPWTLHEASPQQYYL